MYSPIKGTVATQKNTATQEVSVGFKCVEAGSLLGDRNGIRPVKKQSGGVLVWLSVWSKVQTTL